MQEQRLGVDHLTALALPPSEFVQTAAAAGFASVSLRTIHIAGGVPEWAATPLDVGRLAADVAASGVGVHAIEAVAITPSLNGNVERLRAELEAGATLNAEYLYCFADDSDAGRLSDTFLELAALAAEHGLRLLIEPMPYRAVATLQAASEVATTAAACAHASARSAAPEMPDACTPGIIIDTLHASRGGATPADLAALPQPHLAVLQLCDAPAAAPTGAAPSGLHPLMHEARFNRLAPGAGELPLAGFAAAMPAGALITVEAPTSGLADDAGARLRTLRDGTLAALANGAGQ